jgi:hypothetical protein
MIAHAHEFVKATPAMYVRCAPRGWRKIAYGISQVETAKTGDPLQLVDTVTLRVYHPANPGIALKIIHHLESIGHPVAVGAFGFKSAQFRAWHIRAINALNACFSARFAIHLLHENLVWASGAGFEGKSALKISIAAYTVGRLTYKDGGLQYVNAVYYFANQYSKVFG